MADFLKILRWKQKCPEPVTTEQILAVLQGHRLGGNEFNREGSFLVCYCGRTFRDGFQLDGLNALRRHIAEEIAKLQTPAGAMKQEG